MLRNKFTEEEVLAKTKHLESQLKKKEVEAKPGAAATTAIDKSEKGVPTLKPAGPTDVEEWTPVQQKQLEDALRALKDYKDKDKFIKIAASVAGKTPKQCLERYKFLVTLNKKSGTA